MAASPVPFTLHLLLFSGASGTGKSTLAYEVCHRLRNGQHPSLDSLAPIDIQSPAVHAHIDADNLDALHPRPEGSELMLEVLAAQWSIFWRVFREAFTSTSNVSAAGKASPPRTEAVLVISGTGVVLQLQRVVEVVRSVIVAAHRRKAASDVLGDVVLRTTAVVLSSPPSTVEQRLHARVLGGELEAHLASSARMRVLLGEWVKKHEGGVEIELSSDADNGIVSTEKVQVRNITSDRPLQDVTEEVLGSLNLGANAQITREM